MSVFENMEKVYASERNIKYIFEESTNKSQYLIVLFSAMNKPNVPPAYNYYKTIKGYDCNKLFILDEYGSRGCYYLGENNDYTVERSVISLIRQISDDYDIPFSNIISAGTSKGGAAALYFGIKYNFGHVIAGSPQYFIGDFLNREKTKPIMEYITGGCTDYHRELLNNLIRNEIHKAVTFPKITIAVGEGDDHYSDHVIPLVKDLQLRGQEVDLKLGNFSDHNEASLFKLILKRNIVEIIKDVDFQSPKILDLNISVIHDVSYIFRGELKALGKNLSYAWYIYKDQEIVEKIHYNPSPKFEWRTNDKGDYYFAAFVQSVDKNTDSITSQRFSFK